MFYRTSRRPNCRSAVSRHHCSRSLLTGIRYHCTGFVRDRRSQHADPCVDIVVKLGLTDSASRPRRFRHHVERPDVELEGAAQTQRRRCVYRGRRDAAQRTGYIGAVGEPVSPYLQVVVLCGPGLRMCVVKSVRDAIASRSRHRVKRLSYFCGNETVPLLCDPFFRRSLGHGHAPEMLRGIEDRNAP